MSQPAGDSAAQLELLQFLQKLFAASTKAVLASAEAVAAFVGVVATCAETAAASAGAVIGIFGYVCTLRRIICLVHI